MDKKTKTYIISALRRIWRWSKERHEVLRAAHLYKNTYKCAQCKNNFDRQHVKVDHIKPVVIKKFWGWTEYIERLFCTELNLQVLCQNCHNVKSKRERLK